MESPLLEKLHLPPNWRLYETELIDWRKKFFAIPRPIVILPKQAAGKENVNNEIDHDETIREMISKNAAVTKDGDKMKEKIANEKNDQECAEEGKSDDRRDVAAEKTEGDSSENVDTEDNDKKIETQEVETSDPVEEADNQVAQPFPTQSIT